MPADHDEALDAELARIQAEADVKIAEARGRTKGGGPTKATAPAAPAKRDDDRDEESHQTWDDFWAEVERTEAAERGQAATEVIRGVEITVPHDLPLRFQHRLEQIQETERRVKARVADADARIAELEAAKANGADVDDTLRELRAAAQGIGAEESTNAQESTRGLLADLFGADVLDEWIESGMTETELQVVLLWGMAHGKGQTMTHREAYDAYRRAEGKGPATEGGSERGSSSRPSAKRKPRAATGGRSKGTSAGSTGSGRATSRTSRSASS